MSMSSIISNSATSWVSVEANSDFPIQNLPFGIFKTQSKSPRVGVAIGDMVLDIKALADLGYLNNLGFDGSEFENEFLNPMMKKGKKANVALRERIYTLLEAGNTDLGTNEDHKTQVMYHANEVTMMLH